MKLDTRSLSFKLWTYFGLFAAAIMLILWLLQIIFLSTFYQAMKIKEIERIGNDLVAQYGREDFEDILYDVSYKNGIMVRLYDEFGNNAVFTDMTDQFRPARLKPDEMALFLQKMNLSKDGTVSYVMEDMGMRVHVVIFGARVYNAAGQVRYLYISTPLAPVDATVQVLKNQLIIITIISLVFAFVLSYFIARRIAKPISKITKSAEELATGDYNVTFEQGDYTEISQLADVLNHTTKELSKTDELRRDLVANVSHDLRTPLTIIKSYAEMIRDISGEKPAKRQEHIGVIIDESDRLANLVNDLLDLSKMEAGTAELQITAFDLAKTTEDILDRFRIYSENEGYRFEVQFDSGCTVKADQHKMEQVIYNLIGNAVNYTGQDKIVKVLVQNKQNKVRFEVSDTGKGIPQEEINSVWERYYRVSQRHKRDAVGTGIGLSIVKSILEAHKAEYGVNSIIGQGSAFWFELSKY